MALKNESLSTGKTPTKQRIIAAALRCFERLGIEQTKLVDIAQAAKIRHNLIIYHFKDYENLCLACVEQVVHNFFMATQQIALAEQRNAEKHLSQFISIHFQLAQIHRRSYSLWLHFYYKASIDPRYRQLFQTITLSTTEKLKSILLHYCRENLNTEPVNKIENLSQMLLAQIIGQLILSLATEKDSYDDDIKKCFDLAIKELHRL